jgi:hypothetical protein
MLYKATVFWTVIAFLLRLFVGLIIHIYSIQVGFDGFVPLSNYNDDILYWKVSNSLYDGQEPDYVPNIYPVVLSYIFHVTTPDILAAKIVNIVANALSVFFGLLIVRDIARVLSFDKRQTKFSVSLAGLMMALYPSQIFYATQMIKDPFLILFGMINVYASLTILRSKLNKGLGLMWVVSFFGIYTFRAYTALSLLLSILLYLLFVWKTKFTRKVSVIVGILILSAIVPLLLGKGLFAIEYVLPFLNPEKLTEFREIGYSTGASAADITINYSSPLGFLSTYSLSFATAMFGPFPWQVKSPIQVIALPEALIAISLGAFALVFQLKRRKKAKQGKLSAQGSKEVLLLLIFCFTLIGMIALFSDSIGGNTRLRILPWNLFILWISLSFGRFLPKKKKANYVLIPAIRA